MNEQTGQARTDLNGSKNLLETRQVSELEMSYRAVTREVVVKWLYDSFCRT